MEWGDDPALAALLQQFSTWQTMKSATDPNHVASAVPSSQLAVRDKMLHDEVRKRAQ
jgi:hypothetical protein